MDDLYPQQEAERFRQTYYRKPYPTTDAEGLFARGKATRDAAIAKLRANDARIQPFIPMTPQEQERYVAKQFPNGGANAIGIQQMETADVRRADFGDAHRFLATDYILDCTVLALVARNKKGEVIHTSLSHINAWVDAPEAVRMLLEDLPAQSTIDATLLGGPQGDSFYTQVDVLAAVAADPRVKQIRYGFDAASTMAVEVETGVVLTATPFETVATERSITELPITTTFTPVYDGAKVGLLPHFMAGRLFERTGQTPNVPLISTYNGQDGMARLDTTWDMYVKALANDGKLTEDELRAIANDVQQYLKTPVQIAIGRDGQNRSEFKLMGKGVELDSFSSTAAEAEFTATGTIYTTQSQSMRGGR